MPIILTEGKEKEQKPGVGEAWKTPERPCTQKLTFAPNNKWRASVDGGGGRRRKEERDDEIRGE